MACTALILGGSRGLGFHSARALASIGCTKLLIAARSPEGLAKAKLLLEDEFPVQIETLSVDLSRKGSASLAVRRAIESYGGLDYIVLAYGNISREPVTLLESEWSDWVEAASLYLASTSELIRELVKLNSRKASVIILSSFTVPEPMEHLVVADAARAGLSRIVRVAAREAPGRVRPILVLLGSFPTPGAMKTVGRIAEKHGIQVGEFWRSEVESLSPLSRSGSLLEFERLIITLARSPEYLHGGVVVFDGSSGRVAWP